MGDRYNLPAETARLVDRQLARCKNLALILDKYPPQHVVAESKHKGPWLQNLLKEGHIDLALARCAYERWYALMQAQGATIFQLTLDWRMVVGLGGESVLETDITLHHVYGLPFLPGSALKGLTRAYVTGEIEPYKSQREADDHEDIKQIFGSSKGAGTVIFFDALPTDGKAGFVLDIMNPHYGEYYGGKKPPTNDQNPVPVTFLTVTDTTFTFAIAARPGSPKDKSKCNVEQVGAWLPEALKHYGIGGKTSAGYGYFKEMAPLQSASQETATQSQVIPAVVERIRPPLPQFRSGNEITGVVVALPDDLRNVVPAGTQAFLRYQSFDLKDVLIAVSADEAQNWKAGDTRICLFVREEVHSGCSVLICQPRVKKEKKK